MKKDLRSSISNFKNLLLITVIIVGSSFLKSGSINAQNWQWAKSGNGNNTETGKVSCTDAVGNVYVGGIFDSPSITFSASTLINNGGNDVFIARYSPSGALLWVRSFGGTAGETIEGMCTDASGNLYVTGNFSSTAVSIGSVNITNSGGSDIYVASYNSVGNVNWARKDGTAANEVAGGCAFYSASNQIFVTGAFAGNTLPLGAFTASNTSTSGTFDVFIGKYATATGVPAAAFRFGGPNSEYANDIGLDASGSAFIVGNYNVSTVFGPVSVTSSGATDFYVSKIFNAGSVSWLRTGTGTSTGDEDATGVSIDGNGDVYASLNYESTTLLIGTTTLTNTALFINNSNSAAVKYSNTGTFNWVQNNPASSFSYARDITTDGLNNCYVAVHYSGVSSLNTTIVIKKFDSNGNLIWFSNGGGSGANIPWSLSADAVGNVYTTGTYPAGGITLGVTTLTSTGGGDAFTAKIGCISTIISGPLSVCENASTATLSITGGPTSYTWSTGANTSSIVINPSVTTTYSAIGTNSACSANSYPYTVTVKPATVNAGPDLSILCNQSQPIIVVSTPTNPTSVSWSPTVGLSSSTSATTTATAGNGIQSYTVTVVLSNSCVATDVVNVTSYAQKPDICMVTVDSLGINNDIFWEKTLYNNVDSFIVYREVSSNVFKRIAAISNNAYSGFTDTVRSVGPANGDPNTTSYKYKLQIRDVCGNYSALSLWHQTIFIQDQQNGNFNWNSYAIESSGTPVTAYDLFRINVANNTYSLVTSTTAGLATDPQYTAWQTTARWRVQANGFNCNPTNRVSGILDLKIKTKSNIKNDKLAPPQGIHSYSLLNDLISVYPSPVKDLLSINSKALANVDFVIELQNALGQIMYSKKIESNSNETYNIDVNTFANGVYFVTLKQENKTVAVKKIVIAK